MKNRQHRLFAMSALLFGFIGIRSEAAMFVVPADQELVQKARAVVVATVTETHAQQSPTGKIETVATLQVDEVIKGKVDPTQPIELHELGGIIGTTGYIVPGSPKYVAGERALVFLDKNGRGEWATQDLALGRFDFATDDKGRSLLLRDEEGIDGWDAKGREYKEPKRSEREFLRFVRDVAKGKVATPDYFVSDSSATTTDPTAVSGSAAAGAYPASAYLSTITMSGVTRPVRWPSFASPVVFYNRGSQSGYADGGVGAIQAATAAWTNDGGSNVNYQYGGTTTAASGLNAYDSVNSVQFNDPNGEIAGSFTGSGTLGIGGFWVNGGTNSWGGETFYSITFGDVVIQDGVSSAYLNTNRFNQLLTHEIGHTLGLRHSDESTPSTTAAIMRASLVDEFGAVLQQWDRDAIDTVYGSGTVTVSPVSVSAIAPVRGEAWTPTRITLTGSGFVAGATVTVGGIAATNVTVTSATLLSATTPAMEGGKAWGVQVRNPDGSVASSPVAYFANYVDVTNSHWAIQQIDATSRAGIVRQCSASSYCPDRLMTRAEMAMFLMLGKHGASYVPPAATGLFADVPRTDPYAPWIEELSREGITNGCSPGYFCPRDNMTREQMAKLLEITKHGSSYVPPAATGLFSDVPVSSIFSKWIEQLAREGVTSGCTATTYCPTGLVTRAEIAVFLQRLFSVPMY